MKPDAGRRRVSECAEAGSPCDEQDKRTAAGALFLAGVAMEAASMQFHAYALTTDAPTEAVVQAADLLDAARRALEQHRASVERLGVSVP